MKPNYILGLILIAAALLGFMTAYLEANGIREPQWSVVSTSIGFSLLTFWWYWVDSDLRSYRRSPLLNVAVVALGMCAIPYYLIRSREKGKRIVALLAMLGFLVLVVVALLVGSLPIVFA